MKGRCPASVPVTVLIALVAGLVSASAESAVQTSVPPAAAAAVSATEPPAQAPAPPSPPAEREGLSGDWGGHRDQLASRGLTLQFELTGYAQGMFAGDGPDQAEGGARMDAFVNLDTEKLGLWKGGGLRTHLESRFGHIPVFRGGALWPMSTGTALPLGGPNRLVMSSLFYTQRIGTATMLMAGKINAIDLLAADPFFGGWAIHRFQNIAFVAPPSGVVPPVIVGAVLSHRVGNMSLTGMVFDPNDQTNDYWVDGLFSDGVNVSLGSTWSFAVRERATSVGVTATVSTADGADLGNVLLPPELQTDSKDGSYNIAVQASHLIAPSAVLKGKGLGVYGKAAIADGNPNPIQSSFTGGLAGQGMIAARPFDSFGVGYFYYDFSNALQNGVEPEIQFADEQGLELFYSLALARWLRLAADLQVVAPATGVNSTLVVGSLRLNVVF